MNDYEQCVTQFLETATLQEIKLLGTMIKEEFPTVKRIIKDIIP